MPREARPGGPSPVSDGALPLTPPGICYPENLIGLEVITTKSKKNQKATHTSNKMKHLHIIIRLAAASPPPTLASLSTEFYFDLFADFISILFFKL